MGAKLDRQSENRAAVREIYQAVAELGELFFDDAFERCRDDREAAFLASARLLAVLEREHVVTTPSTKPLAA